MLSANMSKQSILIINQYYRPDVASSGQLLADLCEFLYLEGIDVHVITGQPSYTTDAKNTHKYETLNGVHVHRVPMGKTVGRKSLFTRVYGYLRFLWGSWRMSISITGSLHPDVVLTLSNPPLVGLIGRSISRRMKVPYLYVLYDIHPDILITTKWIRLPFFAIKIWSYINSLIFNSSSKIIVPSESMKLTLTNQKHLPKEKVVVIPNWARPQIDSARLPTLSKSDLGIPENNILILYAGNIGIMQQLDPILDTASSLHGHPITFLFIGEGAYKTNLMSRVAQESISNITFLSYQEEQKFSQIVSLADACFVTLQPGLDAYSAPSRAYTFLSAGTPLITLMPSKSELAEMVINNVCGWNVTTSAELTHLLASLMEHKNEYGIRGAHARDLYWSNYQDVIIMKKYADLIKDSPKGS
jgi:glycosyltransferase involved in cell wall biosynthesis